MEAIEAELEAKTIERDIEPVEPIDEVVIEEVQPEPEPEPEKPKKVKKPRSEKQIAAFEKAKQKRAEGIASRKKQKEDDKALKKELKKKAVESIQDPVVPVVHEKPVTKPVINTPNPREQVVNNYYYYGMAPPQHPVYTEETEKKSRKKTRPPTPSSSESESEEEEIPQAPGRMPPKQPILKFRFA